MNWDELRLTYVSRASDLKYNSELFKDYVYYQIDNRGKRKFRTIDDYCRVTFLFLENVQKPISDIWLNDIDKYILDQDSDNRRIFIIPQIANLFSFASSRYDTNMRINAKDINSLKKKKAQVIEKNPPKPIFPDEVLMLRNTLLSAKKIRALLSFELAYCYGLTEQEIAQCNHLSFNEQESSFTLGDGNRVIVPEYLQALLYENMENVFMQYNRKAATNFKAHFKDAGKSIDKNLKWLDIKKTREIYGLTCPYCNKRYPADSIFWGLKKDDNDITNIMHLVCRFCIDKELHENGK